MRKRPNHLAITPEILRAAYDYLSVTPPFSKWNLPDGDDVKFKVAKDRVHYGWHHDGKRGHRQHMIALSRQFIRTTQSLFPVMAHEMCHMHQWRHFRREGEHGAAWQRMADEVCRIHGFDRGMF